MSENDENRKFGKLISLDREFDYELKSRSIDLNGVVDLIQRILEVAEQNCTS